MKEGYERMCGRFKEGRECKKKVHLARDSQAHFWVQNFPRCGYNELLLCFVAAAAAAAARGSWHGRSCRNNAAFPLLPIVHRSLHCSVHPPSLHRPLSPLTPPASWHGDGSAVDKVHNTPSSPRHNSGTWTQAPLWHTRG